MPPPFHGQGPDPDPVPTGSGPGPGPSSANLSPRACRRGRSSLLHSFGAAVTSAGAAEGASLRPVPRAPSVSGMSGVRDARGQGHWFAESGPLKATPKEVISMSDEVGGRVRQMRQKAEELKQAAERVNDPEESRRLKEKARRLQEQSEQESAMGSGDVYPME